MINSKFWKGKRVFLTGHTGFKGTWLSFWLEKLGANVIGYALDPPTNPSLFNLSNLTNYMIDIRGNLKDIKLLKSVLLEHKPEIIFHLAAQPIVRESYLHPIDTIETNVLGTANLFEAARYVKGLKVIINITTDKVYDNNDWDWGYRENDRLGGYDPYSCSKACSELITDSFRKSFYKAKKENKVRIATARAGNVIGGGDWAVDRLIPDLIRSFKAGKAVEIRNPYAVRPWQHVLDPLSGYLLLAQKLYDSDGFIFEGAWNFGPEENDERCVEWIVRKMVELWGAGAEWFISENEHPHESSYLKLDISKAKNRLGWKPTMSLLQSLESIISFYKAETENAISIINSTFTHYTTAMQEKKND